MTPEQRDKKLELIKNQCNILMASFDSVQIFATKDEGDGENISNYIYGGGNWFARYGQVRSWLLRSDYEESIK